MQIYALDPKTERPIAAHEAIKKKNYVCLECERPLHLRGGVHRRLHFYHTDLASSCRQNQKTYQHILIQEAILSSLPENEAACEVRFKEISRVADVAWHAKKIIFEVQCSPITAEEVKRRNADYNKVGYEVVWVLHDQRYNQYMLSFCEEFLAKKTHFYAEITQSENVVIYDQFAIDRNFYRLARGKKHPIKIAQPSFRREKSSFFSKSRWHKKRKEWRVSFEGDLFQSPLHASEIRAIKHQVKGHLSPFHFFITKVGSIYLRIFHMACEKVFK